MGIWRTEVKTPSRITFYLDILFSRSYIPTIPALWCEECTEHAYFAKACTVLKNHARSVLFLELSVVLPKEIGMISIT